MRIVILEEGLPEKCPFIVYLRLFSKRLLFLISFLEGKLFWLIGTDMRDSCGRSGTGETHAGAMRRGGSPPAPRKASILELQSTIPNTCYIATKFAKTALFIN
jgi:hypothetical protein